MNAESQRTAYEVLEVRETASQIVIEAAYRALANVHHPDRNPSPTGERRMAELNRAYALVRTADLRQAYDRLRTPVNPAPAPTQATTAAPRPKASPDVLDFGRYAGWSLRDLARHDPDYLRWLSRHSSGIRHRRLIEELLTAAQAHSASQRVRGR